MSIRVVGLGQFILPQSFVINKIPLTETTWLKNAIDFYQNSHLENLSKQLSILESLENNSDVISILLFTTRVYKDITYEYNNEHVKNTLFIRSIKSIGALVYRVSSDLGIRKISL